MLAAGRRAARRTARATAWLTACSPQKRGKSEKRGGEGQLQLTAHKEAVTPTHEYNETKHNNINPDSIDASNQT